MELKWTPVIGKLVELTERYPNAEFNLKHFKG